MFFIENIFLTFRRRVLHMWYSNWNHMDSSSCRPVCFYSYLRKNAKRLTLSSNFTFRYIKEDPLTKKKFGDYVKPIYPAEHDINLQKIQASLLNIMTFTFVIVFIG